MSVNKQIADKTVTDKSVMVERLVAAALAFVGFTEQGGNNKGQVVERFLRGTNLAEPLPWCAAFVHHIGHWSQLDENTRKTRWPLPATASCLTLYDSAKRQGMLSKVPQRGDLFLMYVPSEKRIAHTGVVLSARALPNGTYDCQTIEGNTNIGGSREGDSVMIRPRVLNSNNGIKSDAFIRWTGVLK
jgi:hypothetical protein